METRPGPPGARGTGAEPSRRRGGTPQVWRLAALSLVLVLLGVFLFPTVSGYVEQRREVSRLERQIEAQRADIADLEEEVQEWNDPTVIERRARERLRFVRPGEVAFTVVDDTGEMLTEPVPGMTAVTNDVHESRPWYGEMWESVKTANEGLPETAPDDR
ncbi:MAG: septum formation initiator family protein [Ornithinimicrobium sp.]